MCNVPESSFLILQKLQNSANRQFKKCNRRARSCQRQLMMKLGTAFAKAERKCSPPIVFFPLLLWLMKNYLGALSYST